MSCITGVNRRTLKISRKNLTPKTIGKFPKKSIINVSKKSELLKYILGDFFFF